jgi:hypothetical protein
MSDIKGHPNDRLDEAHVEAENPRVAAEPTDVDARAITQWGIGLAIFTIASVFLVAFIFTQLAGWMARESPAPSPLVDIRREQLPPEPRLQSSPRIDVKQMREAEDRLLGGFAWTDAKREFARIPIDQAVELMLKKGFPVRAQPVDAATATQRTLPSDSSSGRTYERRAQ